jgi:hypothetical protein
MNRSKKNFANRLFWLTVSFLISFETLARATPIHLMVQPKGSNQVELAFSPTTPDVMYNILVRSNSPDGHWMRFQNLFLLGNTNNILTVTCVLDNAKGPTIQTLTNWTFVAGSWEDSDQDELPDLYEELVSRTDPYGGDDGNQKPANDGRTILQKMQSDVSAFTWENPFPPDDITIRFITNRTATIRWRQWP